MNLKSFIVHRSLFTVFILTAYCLLLITSAGDFFIPAVFAQSPQPTSTVCDSKDISSHEQALCNLNQGLLPSLEDSQAKSDQKSFLDQIISKINELAALLGFRPKQPQTFIPRAELQNSADLPVINCTPEDKNKEVADVAFDLGTSSCPGTYNADLPSEIQTDAKTTKLIEDLEVKSLFPEGIDPFGD